MANLNPPGFEAYRDDITKFVQDYGHLTPPARQPSIIQKLIAQERTPLELNRIKTIPFTKLPEKAMAAREEAWHAMRTFLGMDLAQAEERFAEHGARIDMLWCDEVVDLKTKEDLYRYCYGGRQSGKSIMARQFEKEYPIMELKRKAMTPGEVVERTITEERTVKVRTQYTGNAKQREAALKRLQTAFPDAMAAADGTVSLTDIARGRSQNFVPSLGEWLFNGSHFKMNGEQLATLAEYASAWTLEEVEVS